MFGLIATIRIDPANAPALEREFSALAAFVHANEPDTLAYHMMRKEDDAGVYKVVEVYRSTEALEAHKASEPFKAFRPKLGDWLLEPPSVEQFPIVA